MKTCTNCKQVKNEAEFYLKEGTRLHSQCKRCMSKIKHPDTYKGYYGIIAENKRLAIDGLKRCNKCKEIKPTDGFALVHGKPQGRCKACQNKYYQKNKQHICSEARARHAEKHYGLTLEELHAMKVKQCAICGLAQDLVIDHCYLTQQLRGCLCRQCNAAIGLFKDDPNLVRLAMEYLYEAEDSLWNGTAIFRTRKPTRRQAKMLRRLSP